MEFRTATLADIPAIQTLYREVAAQGGGIARKPQEITEAYVQSFLTRALESGLCIVALDPQNPEVFLGEIHASKLGPEIFAHVLGDLTLVVHPEHQARKVGRTLFTIFLEEIALHRADIARVELIVRESNRRAIALYESMGFLVEGRLEMRVRREDGGYEADIPMAWQNPRYEL